MGGVGLHDLPGMPTKASKFVTQSGGRVFWWSIIGDQVCWTRAVVFGFLVDSTILRSMFSLVVS